MPKDHKMNSCKCYKNQSTGHAGRHDKKKHETQTSLWNYLGLKTTHRFVCRRTKTKNAEKHVLALAFQGSRFACCQDTARVLSESQKWLPELLTYPSCNATNAVLKHTILAWDKMALPDPELLGKSLAEEILL